MSKLTALIAALLLTSSASANVNNWTLSKLPSNYSKIDNIHFGLYDNKIRYISVEVLNASKKFIKIDSLIISLDQEDYQITYLADCKSKRAIIVKD